MQPTLVLALAVGYIALQQLLAGAFIAIAMTGMDQEMMQKSISVRRVADSQKHRVAPAYVLVALAASALMLS